jgi:hypothetical protein
MPLIFRAMLIDGDKPLTGPDRKRLGVRVGPDVQTDDINTDGNGDVHPNTGGMSVSPSVDALPMHRVPRRLRNASPDRFSRATGSNNFACWWMGEGSFVLGPVADHLQLRPDPDHPDRHGFIEPNQKMSRVDYENALTATKDQWQRWE